jgi:hypothetical protein
MNAFKRAELAGFDMSLIDEASRLSPEQRVIQHQAALDLALELERAGRGRRERAESAYSPIEAEIGFACHPGAGEMT